MKTSTRINIYREDLGTLLTQAEKALSENNKDSWSKLLTAYKKGRSFFEIIYGNNLINDLEEKATKISEKGCTYFASQK